MMETMFDATAAAHAWAAVEAQIGRLGAIKSEAAYRRAVRQVDTLLAATHGRPRHPLNKLLDLIAEQVRAFEARTVPIPDAPPADVLRLLMHANDLTQADLQAELGGQSVVSAVLAGKREINARQARALGQRFGVSPAAFIL